MLYGADLDGSGDLRAMDKEIKEAPQYQGAAGVSSLAHAYDEPEVRVDVNTRIDSTYAQPFRGKAPRPRIELPQRGAYRMHLV